MDWLHVTLFVSIHLCCVAGSVISAQNAPPRQESVIVDRRRRPSSSNPELSLERGLEQSLEQGRKVVDSYEITDLKFDDGEDHREILARIIESTQNRHNWYRPAPNLRYRLPTTTKKPPLDEQWLLSAIENFVPSGFVTDGTNPDTNSSKVELRRTTKNVPSATEQVPPADENSYTYLKSTTSTTTSSPPIIWIYTTTTKPPTTPEPIETSTTRKEVDHEKPVTISSTTTTKPAPMRVFPFTRPLVKATSTTTSITSTTKTYTTAAGTAQAYWWEPNPSYQYPDIPPSDSESFYDYGDSPVAHLEHSGSVAEDTKFADLKPSLSIYPSIPRPIRRNTTVKATSTTSTTSATPVSTTSSTSTSTSTPSTTSSTTAATSTTTSTTPATTSTATSTTPATTSTTTSTTPATTSTTSTTTSTTTPVPTAATMPPVDIPDEESGESDYEDEQNDSVEHDGHYVVVNIWNYISGKLTLMGQQKIPADMFENMTVTDGDTVHSSNVPSSVVQLLTNNIAVDPTGSFQVSNTISLPATPPPMTKKTTSMTTTTRKPYGGVGNPSLEGISNIQIRNKTNFQINSAPKPNPYQFKPEPSYVNPVPMSTYRPPAKTIPPHFPAAKPPFFKTTRMPTTTPPVMEYHNPPLDAIFPDFIVEAFGNSPLQQASSSEEVPHYPEVTRKPFATLPYASTPKPPLPGHFANFVPAHKRPEPPRVDPFRNSPGLKTTTSKPAVNSTSARPLTNGTRPTVVKASATVPVRSPVVQTTSTSTGGRNTLVALGLSMLPTMAFALPFIAPLVGRKRRSLRHDREDIDEILRKLHENPWRQERKLPISDCRKFSLEKTALPRHFLLCTGDKTTTMDMILLNY